MPVIPQAAGPKATPWAATVALGILAVRGNSHSTTGNFNGKLGTLSGNWNNVLQGQGIYVSGSGKTTAQSWQAGDQLRYNLSSRQFTFGTLGYLNDRFAGIVERGSEAVGYGLRLIHTPTQEFEIAGGAGADQERAADSRKYITQPVGVFNARYVWDISKHARFSQSVHVESGGRNSFIDPISELRLSIVGNLFAALAYEVRYNTQVPAGTLHSDSFTTINFGYSFGKF
ncbi:MAG TPA: DUF481 domain-containing protein [Nevskiaceae bacterium]